MYAWYDWNVEPIEPVMQHPGDDWTGFNHMIKQPTNKQL